MDKFLMICAVAADFGPYDGEIFSVKAKDIGIMIQAPAWIKNTLMYKWLLEDGSITVADNKVAQKKMENDPLGGLTAEGKKEEPVIIGSEEPVKVKTTRTRAKKGEDK